MGRQVRPDDSAEQSHMRLRVATIQTSLPRYDYPALTEHVPKIPPRQGFLNTRIDPRLTLRCGFVGRSVAPTDVIGLKPPVQHME